MMIDLKDKNQIYQLIAGLSGFTIILIGCLIVLAPFFPAILLATLFALATWPAFSWLTHKMRGRTPQAAFLMTGLLACCFILPLVIIGTSVAESSAKVYGALQHSLLNNADDTAQMLGTVPYAGPYLTKLWSFLAADRERLSALLQEYAAPTSKKLISLGGILGRGLMDVTLGVLIAYFFFRHGTRAAVRLGNLIEKFGGPRGQHILEVSKNTLVGVVYGLLGTAVAQGLLATLGLWLAGVPGATFLGLITFFLSFVPLGPLLPFIPAALWLLSGGAMAKSIFVIGWGLFVWLIENWLKPHFINRVSNLPLLLILLGVLGGMAAFGFIGVFIGPTVLAVAYSLMIEWSNTREKKA